MDEGSAVACDGASEDVMARQLRIAPFHPGDVTVSLSGGNKYIVTWIKQDSPAQAAGLRVGDRLVNVNGQRVLSWSVPKIKALIGDNEAGGITLGVIYCPELLRVSFMGVAPVTPDPPAVAETATNIFNEWHTNPSSASLYSALATKWFKPASSGRTKHMMSASTSSNDMDYEWFRAGHLHVTTDGITFASRHKKMTRLLFRPHHFLGAAMFPAAVDEAMSQPHEGDGTEFFVVITNGLEPPPPTASLSALPNDATPSSHFCFLFRCHDVRIVDGIREAADPSTNENNESVNVSESSGANNADPPSSLLDSSLAAMKAYFEENPLRLVAIVDDEAQNNEQEAPDNSSSDNEGAVTPPDNRQQRMEDLKIGMRLASRKSPPRQCGNAHPVPTLTRANQIIQDDETETLRINLDCGYIAAVDSASHGMHWLRVFGLSMKPANIREQAVSLLVDDFQLLADLPSSSLCEFIALTAPVAGTITASSLMGYKYLMRPDSLPLRTYITEPSCPLAETEAKRARMAVDIANGMAQLHERDLLHGGLCSLAIRVTPNSHARICDYGTHTLWADETSPEVTKYYSPEMKKTRRPSAPSDIYSLGVLLLEVLTWRPYSPKEGSKTIAAYLEETGATINDKLPEEFFSCWRTKSEKRPSADDVHFIMCEYRACAGDMDVGTPLTSQGAKGAAHNSSSSSQREGTVAETSGLEEEDASIGRRLAHAGKPLAPLASVTPPPHSHSSSDDADTVRPPSRDASLLKSPARSHQYSFLPISEPAGDVPTAHSASATNTAQATMIPTISVTARERGSVSTPTHSATRPSPMSAIPTPSRPAFNTSTPPPNYNASQALFRSKPHDDDDADGDNADEGDFGTEGGLRDQHVQPTKLDFSIASTQGNATIQAADAEELLKSVNVDTAVSQANGECVEEVAHADQQKVSDTTTASSPEANEPRHYKKSVSIDDILTGSFEALFPKSLDEIDSSSGSDDDDIDMAPYIHPAASARLMNRKSIRSSMRRSSGSVSGRHDSVGEAATSATRAVSSLASSQQTPGQDSIAPQAKDMSSRTESAHPNADSGPSHEAFQAGNADSTVVEGVSDNANAGELAESLHSANNANSIVAKANDDNNNDDDDDDDLDFFALLKKSKQQRLEKESHWRLEQETEELTEEQKSLKGPYLWEASFLSLLKDSDGMDVFLAHMRDTSCKENGMFWQDIDKLKDAKNDDDLSEAIADVYDKYINIDTATLLLNINPEQRDLVTAAVQKEDPDRDAFAPVQKEVFYMMKKDTYPKFLVSDRLKKAKKKFDKQEKKQDKEERKKEKLQEKIADKDEKKAKKHNKKKRKKKEKHHDTHAEDDMAGDGADDEREGDGNDVDGEGTSRIEERHKATGTPPPRMRPRKRTLFGGRPRPKSTTDAALSSHSHGDEDAKREGKSSSLRFLKRFTFNKKHHDSSDASSRHRSKHATSESLTNAHELKGKERGKKGHLASSEHADSHHGDDGSGESTDRAVRLSREEAILAEVERMNIVIDDGKMMISQEGIAGPSQNRNEEEDPQGKEQASHTVGASEKKAVSDHLTREDAADAAQEADQEDETPTPSGRNSMALETSARVDGSMGIDDEKTPRGSASGSGSDGERDISLQDDADSVAEQIRQMSLKRQRARQDSLAETETTQSDTLWDDDPTALLQDKSVEADAEQRGYSPLMLPASSKTALIVADDDDDDDDDESISSRSTPAPTNNVTKEPPQPVTQPLVQEASTSSSEASDPSALQRTVKVSISGTSLVSDVPLQPATTVFDVAVAALTQQNLSIPVNIDGMAITRSDSRTKVLVHEKALKYVDCGLTVRRLQSAQSGRSITIV